MGVFLQFMFMSTRPSCLEKYYHFDSHLGWINIVEVCCAEIHGVRRHVKRQRIVEGEYEIMSLWTERNRHVDQSTDGSVDITCIYYSAIPIRSHPPSWISVCMRIPETDSVCEKILQSASGTLFTFDTLPTRLLSLNSRRLGPSSLSITAAIFANCPYPLSQTSSSTPSYCLDIQVHLMQCRYLRSATRSS